MRPSDITDGIPLSTINKRGRVSRASMRPSDITDGIARHVGCRHARQPRFNEAVGYYRRNLRGMLWYTHEVPHMASMRPSDITDGILARSDVRLIHREAIDASMRPSDITDGIPGPQRVL